jgi:hypothetical protein
MASSKLCVGLVLASGLLVSSLVSACGEKVEEIKPGPSPGGSSTLPHGGATGTGGATGGTSGAGGVSGGSGGAATGGAAGAGMGVPPVGGKCVTNAVKHAADGLCYCQPSTLTMCTDGCGDFPTDPDHCGNCTTKCEAAQACTAGKCTASPKVLAPAVAGCGSMMLTIASGTVYWTDKLHGTVNSVAAAGGAPKALVTGQTGAEQIAVNGAALYWIANGTTVKQIMTSPLAGGTATAVLKTAPTGDIHGFTFSEDGKTLYYSTDKLINKTPITGAGAGTITEVGHEEKGIPHALAVAGDLIVYPAQVTGDIDVMKMVDGTPASCASPDSAVPNTNCDRLARSQGNLYDSAVYLIEGNAYWLNGNQVTGNPVVNPTGVNDIIAQATSANVMNGTALTILNKVVYFTDDSGYVYSAPLMKNAPVTTLARAQMKPTSIAADAANLYWANGDCSIVALPLK